MTRYKEIQEALAAPFDPSEVEVREVKGRREAYITYQTAIQRLDDVLGLENWRALFTETERGVACVIEVFFEDVGWVAKGNVGGYPGMTVKDRMGIDIPDTENDVKAGYSDALKRAAAMWGVGRHLRADNPTGARPVPGAAPARPEKPRDRWGPPTPAAEAPAGDAPRSGKALFRWVKGEEERGAVGLLSYLNAWGKSKGYPGKMILWDQVQVAKAHAEALRKMEEAAAGVG